MCQPYIETATALSDIYIYHAKYRLNTPVLVLSITIFFITEKTFTSTVNEKGDVGIAKCFSKKYGNKGEFSAT